MKSLLRVLAVLCLVGSPQAFAQETASDEAAAGGEEPDARALMLASAEFLAAQPAFAFGWFVSYDEPVDGREMITYLISGRTTMKRDAGFFSETERGDTLRSYYYDGEVFTLASPDQNFYAEAAFDRGFDALIEAVEQRTGTVLPLWSIMSPTLPERLERGTANAAYLGRTLLAGNWTHHLAFADEREDWQIWIADNDAEPLPLLLIGTNTRVQGWPQYRAHLVNWDLAPETEPSDFVFQPDEDDQIVSMPSLIAAGPTAATGGTE
ncbi:MAG: DUF2092 domain-containing protein [Pseudomonadota bacterium]